MAASGITAVGAGFDYRPRRIEPRSRLAVDDYRLKRYELRAPSVADGPRLSDDEWKALLRMALPSVHEEREHRVGFAILHYAVDGNYLLASRWYGGNMLKHESFTLLSSAEGWRLSSLLDSRIIACVWELEVIAFERNAWVRTAMSRGGTELALEHYLDTTFAGWA